MNGPAFLDFLREQTLGRNLILRTPFGERLAHYFDWTASGRGLRFIEEYLAKSVLPEYANTHTEDDALGRATTLRLHEAERLIKQSVHADSGYHIVHCGAGTTEAIHRLMQILGIYLPPSLASSWRAKMADDPSVPVVFIGPYEHHSNVVPWREGLCHLVEVEPAADGGLDPEMVEDALQDPRWRGRTKIGCFSAASNVTGLRTDVAEIARRLHRHGAYACFDWAAAAPYDAIDVRGENGSWSDAVLFSPHKFLGGPGSSGVLIFHEKLYRSDLPPTFGGGGTVGYVGLIDHDFLTGIEEREKPGTPGILQTLRAALAIEVRDRVGCAEIRRLEDRHLGRIMERWRGDPRIEVLGIPDPARRLGIVAFNIRHEKRHLHPRFVTRLLNDLFGIQTRAGCSCAGPYGHRLLGINVPNSERFRGAIHRGCGLVKPGWVRVNVHYTMLDSEVDYLLDCVDFAAVHGERFLDLYESHLESGAWTRQGWDEPSVPFDLDSALAGASSGLSRGSRDIPLSESVREEWRTAALAHAREMAAGAPPDRNWASLPGRMEELSFFRSRHLRGEPPPERSGEKERRAGC